MRANGRASDPELTSRFLFIPDQSAPVSCRNEGVVGDPKISAIYGTAYSQNGLPASRQRNLRRGHRARTTNLVSRGFGLGKLFYFLVVFLLSFVSSSLMVMRFSLSLLDPKPAL